MKIIQAFSVAACGFPTLAFATPAPAEAMGKDLIASGVIAKPELNARTIIGLCKWEPNLKRIKVPIPQREEIDISLLLVLNN